MLSQYRAILIFNVIYVYIVQILELRTDSGIMSHWKDFQKLVVYTYLSYSASAPFYGAMNKTTNIPMIPLIGYFKAGYLSKLDCEGAELLFEVRKNYIFIFIINTCFF